MVYKKALDGLDAYFKSTFHTLPPAGNSGIPGRSYVDDPSLLVQLLKNGAFSGNVEVGSINHDVEAVMAAFAINSLWIQDKVLIIKISDGAYGKGAGAACKAFPEQTVCIDGIAHIFVRMQTFEGAFPRGYDEGIHTTFNANSWFVFGMTTIGEGAGGVKNANHLSEYYLDTKKIANSADKTQADYGFLYKNQTTATIKALTSGTQELKVENLMFWSIPVCDIDAIIGPEKALNKIVHSKKYPLHFPSKDPIAFWGLCTCLQAKGWPDEYVLKDSSMVPWKPEECRKRGWKKRKK